MWTTNPPRDNAWIDMRSGELGRDEYARFRDTILRQWPPTAGFPLDDETSGQILRAIVDQAVEPKSRSSVADGRRACCWPAARRADRPGVRRQPRRRAAQAAMVPARHRAFLRSVEAPKARRVSGERRRRSAGIGSGERGRTRSAPAALPLAKGACVHPGRHHQQRFAGRGGGRGATS